MIKGEAAAVNEELGIVPGERRRRHPPGGGRR